MSTEALGLLRTAADEARRHDRPDLVERLENERARLTNGAWNVLVAGEFKSGKSAFVNALLGVEVCGADPVDFTQVPTFVRYGEAPGATLLYDDEAVPSKPVPIRAASRFACTGTDGEGRRLRAVEVTLPRALLRDGLVLIDTPGLGGGFSAAQAAATMRAMSMADAVVMVSDAAQEYTAADIALLRRACGLTKNILGVLAKIDLYPQWTRIRDLNVGHLARAGLDIALVPVSSVLREYAIDEEDRAVNAESGFADVARRLRETMHAGREARSGGRTAAALRTSLGQVAEVLETEYEALSRPDEQAATRRRLDEATARADRLHALGARWSNVINDRFTELKAHVERDLRGRVLLLEEESTAKIRTGNPARDWPDIVEWLYERTNEELTEAHATMLAEVGDIDREVAEIFRHDATAISTLAGDGPPAAGDALKLAPFGRRDAGRLEIGMQAARGWSLSSSVVTTVLVATLHPGLLVVLPITLALGSVFAWRAVRTYKAQRLEQARSEALHLVGKYLRQAQSDATWSATSILRHARTGMRDFYQDRADELRTTAYRERAALERAQAPASADRAGETAQDLRRVRQLLRATESLLGPAS